MIGKDLKFSFLTKGPFSGTSLFNKEVEYGDGAKSSPSGWREEPVADGEEPVDEGEEPVDEAVETTRVASVTNTLSLSSTFIAEDVFDISSTGTFSSPTAKIISFCNSSAAALSPEREKEEKKEKKKMDIKGNKKMNEI